MSQHGCPERLSSRSKGFPDEGGSQPTMEVLVETLTGTAFEMTVSPSDTIYAIKSKIFRVEGIPVASQHLLYKMKELEDWTSLGDHAIGDGARLRLVLGMRGGPISTRRLPPPPAAEPWRDIERLLDADREDGEWTGSGCKVTVVVFRDGERVNMLRVRENHDGTYSPVDHTKYSSSLTHLVEQEPEGAGLSAGSGAEEGAGSLRENAVTMGKMLELRRRMESLSLARPDHHVRTDKVEIQKTRSEETLSVPSLLESSLEPLKMRSYLPYGEAGELAPLYDGKYTRYEYECAFPDRYTLLPPIGARADSNQSVHDAPDDALQLSDALADTLAGSILVQGRRERDDDGAILEECLGSDDSPPLLANNLAPISAAEYAGGCVWRCPCAHSQSSSALHARRAAPPRRPHHQHQHHQHLADALFSSSTSDLENLKRNSSRILPALSRHRNREHLHLSDEGLDLARSRRRAERRARDKEPADAPPADSDSTPPDSASPASPASPASTSSTPAPADTTASASSSAGSDGAGAEAAAGAAGGAAAAGAAGPSAAAPAAPAGESHKKPRLRCGLCRKRLSIATEHSCRCGARFCAAHRYAEVHGCAYDYKAGAATLLRHHNPLVTAPKLPKI